MKITLQQDVTGVLKSISYFVACFYAWVESTGISAYAFHVLLGFMVLDMILGAWKAKRVPELENPTSKEAKKGIATKIVMFIIPGVAGLIWGLFDKAHAISIVNTLITALAIAEGYSVIANAGAVYSRKDIKEYDAVTYVFKSLTKSIKTLLEKALQNLNQK